MTELLKPSTLNKIWGATNLVTAPSDGKISTGWSVEIPPWEDFQWLDNRQDQFIAYLNQHGIPEWDSTTEYQTNKSYIMGSDGTIYRCILTHTNKNPVTDPQTATYWVKAFDASDYAYSKSASDAKYLVKANNLSDLTSQSTARTNLGLGTASTLNTGTSAGQVMTVGSFGVGSVSTPATIPSADCNSITATGFYGGTSSTANKPVISGTSFTLIHITYDANNSTQFVSDLNLSNTFFGRTKVAGVWNPWGKNYNSTQVSTVINTFMGSSSAATARSNIGVGSTGALAGTAFMNSGITAWGDAATARTGLGIGAVATESILPVTKGGTGGTTASAARTNLGFANRSGDVFTGDISVYRASSPTTSAIYLNQAGTRYLYVDGTNYNLPNGDLYLNGGGLALSSANIAANQFGNKSLTSNGYQVLPGGLIIQWGSVVSVEPPNNGSVTFPISFPNVCFSVATGSGLGVATSIVAVAPSQTGFTYRAEEWAVIGSNAGTLFFIAIGY